MAALGPRASRRTAFRKLKDLGARTSYSHRGSYYTVDALADFDEHGLWSFAGVRFSRAGTLIATAESFVNRAEAGHFVDELDNLLAVGTQNPLRKLLAPAVRGLGRPGTPRALRVRPGRSRWPGGDDKSACVSRRRQ